MRRALPYLAVCITVTALVVLTSRPAVAQARKETAEWTVSAFAQYVSIPGAKRVGSEACAACHADVSKDFQHAFHAQQGVECEDCHGPGSLHVAGDISKIINYNKIDARDANGACLSCHGQDEKVRNWMTGPHAGNGVRCTDCHQVHQKQAAGKVAATLNFDTASFGSTGAVEEMVPEAKVMMETREEQNQNCLRCHQAQRAQMSMPYHHPLREGKMSCVDCHDPHGGAGGKNLREANLNELCLGCHAQYRGPFAYQHPPVTESCLICHTPHGSPNTNLLSVSEPALCLQCHAGHHNGAGLPLTDRCTDCHSSIHGTDVATPTGGSRFVDKGPVGVPSEPSQSQPVSPAASAAVMPSVHPSASMAARASATALSGGGVFAGMLSQELHAMAGGNMLQGAANPAEAQAVSAFAAYSITPGAYRFVDLSGFGGRVGEYNSLDQSAEAQVETSYVSLPNHMVIVSRGSALSGDDFQATSQVTIGRWAQLGFDMRSFVQQQDHYPFYAFPVLDIPPGTTAPLDTTTDYIPSNALFNVKRRLGSAYGRVKLPRLPVHLFMNGNWQTRVGETQLTYLDENDTPAVYVGGVNTTCGAECHYNSQFQRVNYTTRNISGGADAKFGHFVVTWMHSFSSFNDRLTFPIGTYTGDFTPENEGYSVINPPPSGPAPTDFLAGNYYLDIPSPNQASSDRVNVSWAASPTVNFNGTISYTRLRNTFTNNPQNAFNTDNTLTWLPVRRLRVTADYHQDNVLNNFTPYYTLFGNVSYHQHSEDVRFEYDLPMNLDAEAYYRRSGITRSNAFLWPQIYSIDNTDLLPVVPSSFSNTTGVALRYHDRDHWSARAGYEWTGTHDPGYLLVPQSNNRVFADLTLTPVRWVTFTNDTSVILQNDYPALSLLRADGAGLPGNFQRRDRFYYETASATLPLRPDWNFSLGYFYQQNNLATYMAFQNDSGVNYVLDEPLVPYKQITQDYWAESSYLAQRRFGLNLRVTYNAASSGFRPDVNPNDAGLLGNKTLIDQQIFDPVGFAAALSNIQFAATQISEVMVPQWIGESKGYYLFPHGFNGGLVFYYGSYRDYWNPNLNGVLRTFSIYVGRSW